MGFQRVLIALDGSPASVHAGEVGAEIARSLHAEIALVHAVDPALGSLPESGVSPKDLMRSAENEGRQLLATFRHASGLLMPSFDFVEAGTPVHVIMKAAANWRADMIVIASHGRGGVTRLVLGSVAEGVMRQSTCPVLVVRAAG